MHVFHLPIKFLPYRFFISRAFLVCTENNLNDELDNIRRIAYSNGFKVQYINKLIVNITNNNKPEHKFDSQKYKLYPIQYYPSCLEKLKYSLKRFNIRLEAKSAPKMKNIICTKIDPINFENYSGVYEVPLIRADGSKNYYIGMTNMKFKYRKKEHVADIKYRKTAALPRLHQEEIVHMNFNNFSV